MKKALFLLCVLLVVVGCKINEPAEFLGIENLRVDSVQSGEVIVLADAKYHNPNHLGGKVKSVDIDVLFDGNKVAKLEATKDFVIPTQDEFSIPLQTSIPWKSLSKDNSLLGSIANMVISKEVELDLEGEMKLDYKVFEYKYKIQEHQSINLKK